MTRGRWLMALGAALLVGMSIGVLGGIAFARFVLLPHGAPFADGRDGIPGPPPRHAGVPPFDGPGGGPAAGGPERHLMRLSHALQLSDEQRERARTHMERARGDFDRVRDSLEARIASELNPAQRERWMQMQRQLPGRGARRGAWQRPDRARPGEEGEHR